MAFLLSTKSRHRISSLQSRRESPSRRQTFSTSPEALSTPEFAEIADEAIPLLNDASNKVNLDEMLFQRIQQIYDRRDKMGLTPVQKRLVEKYYRSFAEQGAALPADKKAELVKINDELSKLFIQYNRNLLAATNAFYITVYDKEDLAGLPESSVAQAAQEAKNRGLDGLWVFTLHGPSRLPVLQSADSRGLREAMYKGYTSLAFTGSNSNLPIIEKIVSLYRRKLQYTCHRTDNQAARQESQAHGI